MLSAYSPATRKVGVCVLTNLEYNPRWCHSHLTCSTWRYHLFIPSSSIVVRSCVSSLIFCFVSMSVTVQTEAWLWYERCRIHVQCKGEYHEFDKRRREVTVPCWNPTVVRFLDALVQQWFSKFWILWVFVFSAIFYYFPSFDIITFLFYLIIICLEGCLSTTRFV